VDPKAQLILDGKANLQCPIMLSESDPNGGVMFCGGTFWRFLYRAIQVETAENANAAARFPNKRPWRKFLLDIDQRISLVKAKELKHFVIAASSSNSLLGRTPLFLLKQTRDSSWVIPRLSGTHWHHYAHTHCFIPTQRPVFRLLHSFGPYTAFRDY